MNATPTIETSIEPHAPHWLSRAAFPVLAAPSFLHAGVAALRVYRANYWLAAPLSCLQPSHAQMLIGFHEASHGARPNLNEYSNMATYCSSMATEPSPISETQVRVNYSETDQMGVATTRAISSGSDIARTEHLRLCGASYRELEARGLRLAVSQVALRYLRPARFDDRVRIRCWVRAASRRVQFGYAMENADDGACSPPPSWPDGTRRHLGAHPAARGRPPRAGTHSRSRQAGTHQMRGFQL